MTQEYLSVNKLPNMRSTPVYGETLSWGHETGAFVVYYWAGENVEKCL